MARMHGAEDDLLDGGRRDIKLVLQLVVDLLILFSCRNQFIKTRQDGFVPALSQFVVSVHNG